MRTQRKNPPNCLDCGLHYLDQPTPFARGMCNTCYARNYRRYGKDFSRIKPPMERDKFEARLIKMWAHRIEDPKELDRGIAVLLKVYDKANPNEAPTSIRQGSGG
jgi:hypothetical protein